jgi:hypothetical protein
VKRTILFFVLVPALLAGTCVVFGRLKPRALAADTDHSLAAAGAADSGPSAADCPTARVELDHIRHQFGRMAVGETGRHTFRVRNAGTAPLLLKQGRTSCKCTLSRLTADAVPPGGSAEVELEWKPEKPEAEFSKYATFGTNDPQRRRFTLSIEGAVESLFELAPDSVWHVGEVLPKETARVEGTIQSRLLETFSVLSASGSDPRMHVDVVPLGALELKRSKARCGYRVRVSFPGEVLGARRALVTLRTDIGGGRDHQLEIAGRPAVPLQLFGANWTPHDRTLHFETFAAAKGARQILVLAGPDPSDRETFRVLAAQVEPEQVQVEAVPAGDAPAGHRRVWRLDVKIPAGAPPAWRTFDKPAHVKLKTNHPDYREIDFSVAFVSY